MPATEETWRNQKLLHVVFGLSSLGMLLASLLLFAKDHDRQWKGYQRTYRDVEKTLTDWQLAAEKSRWEGQQKPELEQQLAVSRAAVPAANLYDEFKQLIQTDAEERQASPVNFADLDAIYETLGSISSRVAELGEQLAQAQRVREAATKAVAEMQAQPPAESAETSEAALAAAMDRVSEADVAVSQAREELGGALEQATEPRAKFFAGLTAIVDKAKYRENQLLSKRKFRAADFDATRANLDLLIRDEAPESERAIAQEKVDVVKADLDRLTVERERSTTFRLALEDRLRRMQADELGVLKRLADGQAESDRLQAMIDERDSRLVKKSGLPGKRWLELPILDAFNSPLKIDNLWTEGLTLVNGSFGQVRRFDRCTTCHKGIDKTAAGSALEPAYVPARDVSLTMAASESTPAEAGQDPVMEQFGLQFADCGLVSANDVTVSVVEPQSRAAVASVPFGSDEQSGIQVGDIVVSVAGDRVVTPADARRFLLAAARTGQPIEVTVRRGLPQPFTSHPRLDLFVGSMSPHPMAVFACTSCHEGQGSATDFKYASHAPNTYRQGEEWAKQYGWFNNPHWIYPMYPQRFTESTCLRCHHDVQELAVSERFPDAPAPKLMQGYNLAVDYGCYGCHEINGYAGKNRRIGPDLRLEPNYFAAAAAIKADPGFAKQPQNFQADVADLIDHPDRDAVRQRIREHLASTARAADPDTALTPASLKMRDLLQDDETPGRLRKVGPSLRYVGSKLGREFLYDWIQKPAHFRPTTRMPQFFGLWKHLADEPDSLKRSQRWEPVEIMGLVSYLLDRSQPFEYLDPPAQKVDAASAERGKLAFEVRGCLACHQHADFPGGKAMQGPDLSNFGDKMKSAATPDARGWLTSWLRQPNHYSPRTKMPNLILDPMQEADGKWVDPVADIAEYLLGSSNGWAPAESTAQGLRVDPEAVDEVVFDYLRTAFTEDEARQYVANGIPADMGLVPGVPEHELVGAVDQQAKLRYIGQKTINKYGCYACHDIPGFEDAKPIGTALADWGRKESAKLAFEHIAEYLGVGHHGGGHGQHADAPDFYSPTANGESTNEKYFGLQVKLMDRSGFLWQKLREPRSYDFMKTANKPYSERLRMPLFPLTEAEREAVMTFVLGLVAEPPSPKFVYKPDARNKAIQEGMAVVENFNCGGCHILEAEKWQLAFRPGDFREPPTIADFPFVLPTVPADALAQSAQADPQRGLARAEVYGLRGIDNGTGETEVWDEEGDPLEEEEEYDPSTLQHPFDLWDSAAIDGHLYEMGVANLAVPANTLRRQWGAQGGDLTYLLLPRVVELEKLANPSANGKEAWGWLPPPLVGEGRKVQPDWLHDFLLDPQTIRPATFLRMPKFNMSPDEARKLVDYFAAKDDYMSPYEFDPRTSLAAMEATNARFAAANPTAESRLDHAMKIVTNTNYCVKCHWVGAFRPEGSLRAQAPDLAQVQFRMRPEYVRKWVANPKRILPYTNMPVNIPYDPTADHLGGVSQEIYPGTSIEQLDGLVDLLMNYSYFTGSKNDIAELVKDAAAEEAKRAAQATQTSAAAPRGPRQQLN